MLPTHACRRILLFIIIYIDQLGQSTRRIKPVNTSRLFFPPRAPQGCLRHPSFGYISDMKARRCARHRLQNMESVKGRRQNPRRKEATDTAATDTSSTSYPALPPRSAAAGDAGADLRWQQQL